MKYFDYASTTSVDPEVLNTYHQLLEKYYINSESIYPSGVEVNTLMEKSRNACGQLLGVNENEIIFTSGGSEANNLAIKATALKRSGIGRHIITSAVEHSSVLNSCRWLKEYFGFEVTYLPVGQDGSIRIEDLKNALRDDTILVSIMYVNNESGAIMPIKDIKTLVRKYHNCYLHVDCVQALGKMDLDLSDIDMASFSAHKINGLKGCGMLMKKQHVQLAPVISGGQQENHLRGGTANAPANMVMAKTLRLALERLKANGARIRELHDYLYEKLQTIDSVVLNSPKDSASSIVNFSSLKVTSQVMMNALYNKGYEVSAQSTCDSNDATSRVIAQMYKEEDRLKGTIRISLSYPSTKEDVDGLIAAIKESIEQYGTH